MTGIIDGDLLWLSSGLEDYFLGAYFREYTHSPLLWQVSLPMQGFTIVKLRIVFVFVVLLLHCSGLGRL